LITKAKKGVIKMDKIVFGSDVEVAAVIPNSGKVPELVPPGYLRHILGMKIVEEDDKNPVFLVNNEYKWFQDGALCETAFPPVKTAKDMFTHYNKAKEILADFLSYYYSLQVWDKPVATFNVEKYVKMGSKEVKASCIAGCDPDDDVFDNSYECKVRDLTEWNLRGAGGHLHISIPETGDLLHKLYRPTIKLLAISVGNMGIYINSSPELERMRREVFGAAGRARMQTYPNGDKGVEYRSLSNDWLSTLEGVEIILNTARWAIKMLLNEPKEVQKIIANYTDRTITTIASVDRNGSKTTLKELGLL
jgi:hypothetical protein